MIEQYVKGTTYPILYNAAIGHTSPIITVPLGARVLLDAATNTFSLQEGGVM